MTIKNLQPFVPSGKDFALACRFFEDLGFAKLWENRDVAGFAAGDAKFILQAYDVKEFAENYMVRVEVEDLDAWWAETKAKELDKKYPGVKLVAPKDFPWGREVNIIDPAGVCWHIA